MIVPLLYSTSEATPRILCLFLDFSTGEIWRHTGESPRGPPKQLRSLQHFSNEKRQGQLRLFSLEEGEGDLKKYKYLKEGCREDRVRFFLSGAQCQDQKQWAQTEIQEVPSECEDTSFKYKND